jgi:hypothetical protein
MGRKPKVFCIGANKTGTTSVEMALKDLGYRMGDQDAAQGLLDSYGKRQFADIVSFCSLPTRSRMRLSAGITPLFPWSRHFPMRGLY